MVGFGIAEGLFAGTSALAAQNPKSYGAFMGLLAVPLGTLNGNFHSEALRWASFGGGESLALYNFAKVDEDAMSKTEIFQKNMVAWHVYFGIIGVTYLFTRKPKSSDATLDFQMKHHGPTLTLRYRFGGRG